MKKNPISVAGGNGRAKKLSPERRSEIARLGGNAKAKKDIAGAKNGNGCGGWVGIISDKDGKELWRGRRTANEEACRSRTSRRALTFVDAFYLIVQE